jgi:hypothetical protein
MNNSQKKYFLSKNIYYILTAELFVKHSAIDKKIMNNSELCYYEYNNTKLKIDIFCLNKSWHFILN